MPSLLRCLLLFCVAACGLLLAFAAPSAQAARTMTKIEGVYRSYEVVGLSTSQTRRPLLIVLHPQGGNASLARKYGLEQLAQQRGWLVLYPEAQNGTWQDGRDTDKTREIDARDGSNDVLFVLGLINRLAAQRIIDPNRVMITGLSNGGIMAQRLACQMPGRVVAMAAVNGLYPQSLACVPSHPVDVLLMQGTADRYIPYMGGNVGSGRQQGHNGAVRSAEVTAAMWRVANACPYNAKRTSTTLDRLDLNDPSQVHIHKWQDCPVYLYEIEGAGHQWPGRPVTTNNRAMRYMLSPSTSQIRAEKVVIDFFAAALARHDGKAPQIARTKGDNVLVVDSAADAAAMGRKQQQVRISNGKITSQKGQSSVAGQGGNVVREQPLPSTGEMKPPDTGTVAIPRNEKGVVISAGAQPAAGRKGPVDLLAPTQNTAAPVQDVTVTSQPVSVAVPTSNAGQGVKTSAPTAEALARKQANNQPGVRVEAPSSASAPSKRGGVIVKREGGRVTTVQKTGAPPPNTLLIPAEQLMQQQLNQIIAPTSTDGSLRPLGLQ